MKKKSLALLLAAAMLLALPLTACKSGSGDGKETDAPTADETVVTAPETNKETPTEAVTDPVTDPETAPETAPETTPEVKGPTITLSSTEDLTITAGETIALPTVKATDTNGKDISGWVEITDSMESDSVTGGKFHGQVAGDHTVYYYVENDDGDFAEAFLTVHVNPVKANTFDVQGMDDCANMGDFKTFRDGFEKGRKSPLFAAIGDAGKSAILTAGPDAIEGNSLVIDFAAAGGSSNTAIYLLGFNDYFNRNQQTTYRVTFSYKVVEENGNTGDIYFGLSWDGSTGINRQFVASDAEVGDVRTFTTEFPAAIVPDGVTAYFFLFKLNATDQPVRIALDNFIIETVELEQIKSVVPTAAELAKGFTWDFTTASASAVNGQVVPTAALPDAVRNAIAGSSDFGTNVLKLTSADDHSFSGLTANNLIEGKRLIVDIEYFAVNDDRFYLIMMGKNGNPTQTVTSTREGDIVKVHLDTLVAPGWYQLNIYGQNNPKFEIYIGKITVSVIDRGAPAPNTTPNGHAYGMSFTQSERPWGMIDDPMLTMSAYDGYDFGADAGKMGTNPTKFVFKDTCDKLVEWFQAGGKMESGYTYRITTTYYVASFTQGGSPLMFCIDRAAFMPVGGDGCMTPGFHQETIEWAADRSADYVSFYLDGTFVYNGVVYVKDVTVTLVGPNE